MKFLFLIITFFSLTCCGFSHPDHGELLCFETTNFDIGESYINDKKMAYFIFVNCSHDTVIIADINSENTDRPYVWDRKLRQKNILPGQKDTIRFYRNFRHQEAGLYDQSFTISFKDSHVEQYLNIFCELKHNGGHLEAAPIKLDTVNRGDTIVFKAFIKNTGIDPIEISPRYYNQAKYIRYLDKYPINIPPKNEVALSMQLPTNDLCRFFKKSLSFYSNEETDRSYYTFNITYCGALHTKEEPYIAFDSLVMTNYVNKRERCVYNFSFTNTGDIPLIIAYAKTSCGCLVASYPKEPIPPNGKGEISVKYDSKRIGPINKSITVRTNACKEHTVLRVKGFVKGND